MSWILLIVGLSLAWSLAIWLNRRSVRAYDGTGDPDGDIVIFAEPIRWLFVIWGFPGFCDGLRLSGSRAQIILFRWCSAAGALMVFPDLVRRRRQQRKAARLARRIDHLAEQYPGRCIHLVGYSSGTFLVLEACRRVTHAGAIGKVILLAGSVSPKYPLDALPGTIRELHNFQSALDWITGIGPLLFGSNDRRWSPGCGTVGFASSPPFLTQHAWRSRDVKLGYFGDHFSIASPPFVANRIADILNGRSPTTPPAPPQTLHSQFDIPTP
jgi:hypothetical protein